MFNFNHVQAIYLSLFIKFLQGNLQAVNKAITSYRDDPFIFMLGEYLSIRVTDDTDRPGQFGITFNAFGETHYFKLGKNADGPAFNKSTLNDLQVWFHRIGRPVLEEAQQQLSQRVNAIDLRPTINSIGLIDRLLHRQIETRVDYQSMIINALIPTRIVIHRTLFNKLSVFVDVSSPAPTGTATDKMPVHFGCLRSYMANPNTDPVNRWFHETVLEHTENNLK